MANLSEGAMQKFLTAVITLALSVLSAITLAALNDDQAKTAFEKAMKGDVNALSTLLHEAEQGNALVQYNLGALYSNSRGVRLDEAAAAKWYRMAAEQGGAEAQSNLGVCYFNGQGVARDYAEAKKWLKKAADQGDALSYANFGVMYANGQGVPRDFVEAYKWIVLSKTTAATGGGAYNNASGMLDQLGKSIQPAEIERARQAATAWMIMRSIM